MKTKNYNFLFFIYFLFFGLVIEAVVLVGAWVYNHSVIEKTFDEKFEIQSQTKVDLVKSLFQTAELAIEAIELNPIFTDYIDNPHSKNQKNVQNLFAHISASNPDFMQVRYLNEDGVECVRVDAKAKIITDEALQDKSQRYYFKDTMRTKKGRFWYSALDLNIENGAIEVPHKPTIRIAKRFFKDGESLGIIIVNISLKDRLEEIVSSYDFYICIRIYC